MRPFLSPNHCVSRPRRRLFRSRSRRGHILIECCVSAVVLAGAGALVLLLTSTTAQLIDESRQQDLVMRHAAASLNRAAAAPCLIGTSRSREPVGPRAQVDVSTVAEPSLRTMTADAWWQSSVMGQARWRHHATTVSGWCE